METTDGGRIDTEYYFFEPSLRYDLLKKNLPSYRLYV